MDCNGWREMASDLIEETLPPAMRDAMVRHSAECPTCRADHAALIALSRELNVLPTVDPPLFFAENVLSAIERQPRAVPMWRRLLFGPDGTLAGAGAERVTRTAFGTLLAAGAAAAIGFTMFAPGHIAQNHPSTVAAGVENPAALIGLLPGGATNPADATDRQPALRITRVTTMTPNSGPSYDLSFWLSNADHGVARWQFVGDPRSFNFALKGAAPQTVRIPYTAAQGKDAVELAIRWTADAETHTRCLVLPVAQSAATAASPSPLAMHQSFGLPDESLVDAARDISGRYDIPITFDDVPTDTHVRITAEDETAAATLRRYLKADGLMVTETAAGIRVSR